MPILALPFKLFKPFISGNFQFFSFWYFICFYLQLYFSFKIIKKFTNSTPYSLVGSFFFLIAPIFIYRLGFHVSLISHWLLLWALYLALTNKINEKYINLSARKISHRLKVSKWKKKGVVNHNGSDLDGDLKAALILPDGKPGSPTFLVFENYEKILKWNRSLRFGISVCTLANMIKA